MTHFLKLLFRTPWFWQWKVRHMKWQTHPTNSCFRAFHSWNFSFRFFKRELQPVSLLPLWPKSIFLMGRELVNFQGSKERWGLYRSHSVSSMAARHCLCVWIKWGRNKMVHARPHALKRQSRPVQKQLFMFWESLNQIQQIWTKAGGGRKKKQLRKFLTRSNWHSTLCGISKSRLIISGFSVVKMDYILPGDVLYNHRKMLPAFCTENEGIFHSKEKQSNYH